MAFALAPLPYSPDALAPHLSRETLELHHGKHHQAYVTALNGLVEKNPALQGKSLEELIKLSRNNAELTPVFNNAGQHWNHSAFWQSLSPQGGGIPGSLDKVVRLVKVLGMVNCTPDFHEQPKVINGFSDLMVEVLGESSKGARSAVGMVALPGGIAVEIEAIFKVKD